jgi:hypothetical protein
MAAFGFGRYEIEMFCFAMRMFQNVLFYENGAQPATSHYNVCVCLPLARSGAAACASGLDMISLLSQDVGGRDRGRHR